MYVKTMQNTYTVTFNAVQSAEPPLPGPVKTVQPAVAGTCLYSADCQQWNQQHWLTSVTSRVSCFCRPTPLVTSHTPRKGKGRGFG